MSQNRLPVFFAQKGALLDFVAWEQQQFRSAGAV